MSMLNVSHGPLLAHLLGGFIVISKELIGASTRAIILSILNRSDSYGYAIIQDVRDRSGGTLDWKEGMLYPVLHRLEDERLIESFWHAPEGERRRKYYRLLPAGAEALESEKQNWLSVDAMLAGLWGLEPRISI